MECHFACKTYVKEKKDTTEVNLYNYNSDISFVTQTFDEGLPTITSVG